MTCSKCGKPITKSYGGLCQGCYNYYKDGGTENPLPQKGVIAYDSRGYVVCHICGRAYKRLGSHIKESHNMNIAKYKEQFELCANAKTTENNYSQHMHNLAYKHKMPQRLIQMGEATRFHKGDKTRLGKKTRLQESLMKKARKQ